MSPEGSRLSQADQVEFVVLPNDLTKLGDHQEVWLAEQDVFELVTSNDYWSLYRRR